MYFTENFGSKAAAKRALANGSEVRVKANSPFEPDTLKDGKYFVEGPWYPKPHTFYGSVIVKDGLVVSIK